MKNVFIPPIMNWDFNLTQLPQQIASQFVHNGYNVYYCNERSSFNKKVQVHKNLTVYSDWNAAIEDINTNKIKIDIFYNTAAKNYPFVTAIKPDFTIYHSCDSFWQWKPYEPKMMELSNVVFCTSDYLYEIRKKEHNNVHLAKNGCNKEIINCDYEMMDNLKFIKRPVCIFSGACGEWVRTSVIKKVATDYYTYFVGASFGKPIPDNVHFQEAVKHPIMVNYLRNMDIGLLPFNKNSEITIAANPIKLWEYLACGLPVVATDWGETNNEELKDVVYVAQNDDDFLDIIDHIGRLSLMDLLNLKEECYKVAMNNTWEKRFEVINAEIKKFFE